MDQLYKVISHKLPWLGLKLVQARMSDTPEFYVKKTFTSSLFASLAIIFILFMFMKSWKPLLGLPIIFWLLFMYFLGYVDMKISKIKKGIEKEIIFAGRFLIIELESGVPFYKAFQNLSKNYEQIGYYFREIVEKIDLGTSLEDALNESVKVVPSDDLRKVFWQLLNSIKTGSEAAHALTNVFDQIVRKQQIAVKEYGRKLNPMAMFYMMAAIILPSLGTIMFIIVAAFIGLDVGLVMYGAVVGFLGFIQFMFLSAIKSSRPPMDL